MEGKALENKDNWFVKTFSNDNLILTTIIIYALCVTIQEFNVKSPILTCIDECCTLIFVFEMIAKHIKYGFKGYWTHFQSIFDGILVIASLPSLLSHIMPMPDFSFLLVLRTLRILRIFKVLRVFKDLSTIGKNFLSAMTKCSGLFASFAIIIMIIALICCSLYHTIAPEYFGDPFASIYSIFRLFSVEGWYEIPDTIAERVPGFSASFARFFFSMLLILGGIIGLSLINSVFVDEMVSDNNDDMEKKIDEMQTKINSLESKLDKILNELEKK